MNKQELIKSVSDKTGISKSDTQAVIDAFIHTVELECKDGNEVRLLGFGTFSAKRVAERTGRNPQTGETVVVAAHTQPKFSPGSHFKELVNSK